MDYMVGSSNLGPWNGHWMQKLFSYSPSIHVYKKLVIRIYVCICSRRETVRVCFCFLCLGYEVGKGWVGQKKVIRTYTPKTQSVPGWWFGTFFIFHILGIIIPTGFHIFQRGWNHQPVYDIGRLIDTATASRFWSTLHAPSEGYTSSLIWACLEAGPTQSCVLDRTAPKS